MELAEVYRLLEAHPGFRVAPVSPLAGASRRKSALGRMIQEIRLQRFGAQFERSLTLLHFSSRVDGPRRLSLDLHWHARVIRSGWAVFIHFVDPGGGLRFQADYALDGEAPDALNFVYSRKAVLVPQDAPQGVYRVRLGVWSPREGKLLKLTRFRGCRREERGIFHDSVILDTLEIGEQGIV